MSASKSYVCQSCCKEHMQPPLVFSKRPMFFEIFRYVQLRQKPCSGRWRQGMCFEGNPQSSSKKTFQIQRFSQPVINAKMCVPENHRWNLWTIYWKEWMVYTIYCMLLTSPYPNEGPTVVAKNIVDHLQKMHVGLVAMTFIPKCWIFPKCDKGCFLRPGYDGWMIVCI